jgi:YVTN family beta-propeller protein
VRALALLAAICVVVACEPPPPAPLVLLAPVTLGQRPIRPVPAFGSVWVANAADGTLTRVDAVNGAIIATIRVADPQRLLAAGCAPSSEHAYATGSFGLRACDSPSAVAAGAGAVWATANDANAIVRVDPARNAVADTVAVGFNPWGVVAGDDAVWVSDYVNDAVVRVDPKTLRVTARIPVASGPTEMALAPGTLWVVNSAAGLVSRIDTGRNAVVATVPVSAWALAVAVFGDDVWVRGGSARGDGGLSRIDTRTNTLAATYQGGAPQGREGVASIAASERGVWVPGVTLELVDRATGSVATRVPIASYAVALDGPWLWILDVLGHLIRYPARR